MILSKTETVDMIFHNGEIAQFAGDLNSREALDSLVDLLQQRGTFRFPATCRGLFPASAVTTVTRYTKYDKVWVRDNVYVAYAHWLVGRNRQAVRAAAAR